MQQRAISEEELKWREERKEKEQKEAIVASVVAAAVAATSASAGLGLHEAGLITPEVAAESGWKSGWKGHVRCTQILMSSKRH